MRLQEEREGRGERVPPGQLPGSPPQRTSLWSQPPPMSLKAEFTRMSGGLWGGGNVVLLSVMSLLLRSPDITSFPGSPLRRGCG